MLACLAALVQDVVTAQKPPEWLEPFAMYLVSYTGLALGVALVVELLKKWISKGWMDGKEQYSAFFLAPAAGSIVKAMGWAYTDMLWWGHIVLCLFVGASAAGYIHDKWLNRIIELAEPALKNKKP
jgi:hypothetical protein